MGGRVIFHLPPERSGVHLSSFSNTVKQKPRITTQKGKNSLILPVLSRSPFWENSPARKSFPYWKGRTRDWPGAPTFWGTSWKTHFGFTPSRELGSWDAKRLPGIRKSWLGQLRLASIPGMYSRDKSSSLGHRLQCLPCLLSLAITTTLPRS